MQGDYAWRYFEADLLVSPGGTHGIFWGDWAGEPDGTLLPHIPLRRNDEGSTSGILFLGQYVYQLSSYLHWSRGVRSLPSESTRGGMHESGTMTIAASARPGSSPAIECFLRKGTGFSEASLVGEWETGSIGHDGLGQVSASGSMTFDGAGNVTYRAAVNNGVAIVFPLAPLVGTYTVDDGGRFEIEFAALDFVGQLAESGTYACYAGRQNPTNNHVCFGAMVAPNPGPLGLTDADLVGNYTVVGMEYDTTWKSFSGVGEADGAGRLHVSFLVNEEGVLTLDLSETLDTSVGAPGTLELSTMQSHHGGLSPDGDFGFVAGGATAGDPPAFFMLLRR